jgi:hypothetical protein
VGRRRPLSEPGRSRNGVNRSKGRAGTCYHRYR